MIELVISGGQTGGDLAGLVAAERAGIKTGGLAPKGYRTEVGNKPLLKTRYGLKEHSSKSYVPRTQINASNGDVTIILSPIKSSSGTKLTIDSCVKHGKEYILVNPFKDPHSIVLDFLAINSPKVVNVAGNRESVSKGLTKVGAKYLEEIFKKHNFS